MNQTLLVADGDAELCEVHQRCFTATGYDVETASNALDCLEKHRRGTPGAIVLDRELCGGRAEWAAGLAARRQCSARNPCNPDGHS
jgi:DNA-binding response OmpR family regulator